MMKELESKLKEKSTSLPQGLEWKEAELPFFSSSDPTLRALVALSLGCDVFEGTKNLGPKTIKDNLDKIISQNVPMIPAFKNIMKEKTKALDESIINTLVSAFLFEPGLVDTSNVQSNVYIHEPPVDYIFPTFIESFSMRQQDQLVNPLVP